MGIIWTTREDFEFTKEWDISLWIKSDIDFNIIKLEWFQNFSFFLLYKYNNIHVYIFITQVKIVEVKFRLIQLK